MTDIVIPLSLESKFDNLELRLALRSIEKYATNIGNIHVVTADPLKDFKNINVIYQQDTEKHLKDVNLINKIITAASHPDVSQNFMFWSDDQLLTAPLDLDKAPIVSNSRTKEDFKEATSKWQKRLLNTLEYVEKETGKPLAYNYDSHVPQPYNKTDVGKVFSTFNYTQQPGFCINTIYYGLLQKERQAEQHMVKHTFQGGFNKIPKNMLLYAGYDDASFTKGMCHFFLGMFYNKSKYQIV